MLLAQKEEKLSKSQQFAKLTILTTETQELSVAAIEEQPLLQRRRKLIKRQPSEVGIDAPPGITYDPKSYW